MELTLDSGTKVWVDPTVVTAVIRADRARPESRTKAAVWFGNGNTETFSVQETYEEITELVRRAKRASDEWFLLWYEAGRFATPPWRSADLVLDSENPHSAMWVFKRAGLLDVDRDASVVGLFAVLDTLVRKLVAGESISLPRVSTQRS